MKNLPSPCVSICKLNKSTGFCEGCFRTKNEIALWPSMNNDERLSLLPMLRERQGLKRRVNRRSIKKLIKIRNTNESLQVA